MSDSPDVHLQLKKRARRRLVGAIAVAGLAAVVLPMVMDEEPKQQVQDVQIRIPGQNQTPFNPKVSKPAVVSATGEKPQTPEKIEPAPPPVASVVAVNKPAEKPPVKPAEIPAIASDNESYLILIGAFSNPANVKQLQTKIGELGIRVFTESLDSPDGKKTRVRAGPFASREAADKALAKMKRIGVSGVVAAKQ
ncbi:SPOR domain-containing protein [Propionivibrio sp.]|uniref:SPOR domain-containing protein n=1 Tax=Propionivibrio sp. TaxID=2212460 RepID=UPI00262519EA|nr:SPOR domain-containing protein [Propionivibrio sp.]